ncbi:hypothetical protein F2P81_009751 [Scophthalmus maximus]|uniref:Uncharacterized protein n=1 Tax=Scophthalmus maximus TaxID=52904 RepID=A0A6A4STV0_SCOMX|nr:hypothetical protein F2P81_009751 [Scophthalmus maximus]
MSENVATEPSNVPEEEVDEGTEKDVSHLVVPSKMLGHGSIGVLLLLSPLTDASPSDAPVPIEEVAAAAAEEEEEEEEEEEGASLSFCDCQADSPLERLNTGGRGEEEEEEVVGERGTEEEGR